MCPQSMQTKWTAPSRETRAAAPNVSARNERNSASLISPEAIANSRWRPAHRMSPNWHIVGGIKERRINMDAVSDDLLQKLSIAAVATAHPVIPENPDIARLRSGRYRSRGDDLVVRIGGRRQDYIDLAGRKPGQGEIEIDIDRSQFAEF